MLPDGWKSVRFGDIITFSQYGISKPASIEGNTPILGMSNIVGGKIVAAHLDSVHLSDAERSAYLLTKGDILFNRTNSYELVGKTALFSCDAPMVCASYLVRFQVDTRRALPEYVCYFFNMVDSQRQLRSLATRGVSQCNINPTTLGRYFRIPLPSLGEQAAITVILDTWDEAIDQTQKLVDAKRRLKRGLMQQLLTGKRRFKEFGPATRVSGKTPQGWTAAHFGEVFRRVERAVPPGTKEVLSITATVGFVHQSDKFSRIIAGKNIERYVLLKRGDFSYNKGNSKAYPQGCIYRLDEYDQGAVPNVYFSFSPGSDKVDSDFYKYYFEGGMLNHQLKGLINTGVRNDGLLNLYADQFFRVKVMIPPIDEQKKVAKLLTALSREIELLQSKLTLLKSQKRGLMQVLLTGKVRVKTPSAPAAVNHLPDVRKMVSVGANSRRKAKK